MTVFSKITISSLKKNRSRTVVTIIGIMLSAAMICAVTTFVSSFYNYLLENEIYAEGDWHGSALDADGETYRKISESDEISSFVYTEHIGYAKAEGSLNENKPYLFVMGASRDFMLSMPVHITAGRLPASQSEVILPSHLYENGGILYKLGDEVTLDIGFRSLDGSSLSQQTPCFFYNSDGGSDSTGETLVVNKTHTYTVVGFYERPSFEPYTAPGYTLITLEGGYETQLYDVYFKMNDPQDVYNFMKNNDITGKQNYDVLMYMGAIFFDGFSVMINSLAAIVIVLIMFGSISLIYNAFSISVSERTRLFGLLSSVGATKKQLKEMVLFESFAVSLIGIPLGIIAGIGGISVTLLALGNKFQALGFSVPMRISVSPLSVVIAALVSLLTVLIAAWIPASRATKVSAVEAIRQNRDIATNGKDSKTSKLVFRVFGFCGMLAQKHYKRSRKKYRSTILSLFMSILLFVSTSSFCDYLTESAEGGFDSSGYDLRFICESSHFSDITKDELLSILTKQDGITEGAYAQSRALRLTVEQKHLSDQSLSGIETPYFNLSENKESAAVYSLVCFINDSEFISLLREYGLDEKAFMNKETPKAVAVDGNTSFSTKDEKYIKTHILASSHAKATVSLEKDREGYYFYGDVLGENGETLYRYAKTDDPNDFIDVSREEAFDDVTLDIGQVIFDCPYYFDTAAGLILFYPDSLKAEVFPEMNEDMYSYKYYFLSSDHKVSYKALKTALNANGFNGNNLFNYAEQAEESRNVITIVTVFSYGFIVLISLIAAANVFNTISTNFNLRRREFAMLRSVGLSVKGLYRMLNFECLLYGAKALLLGLPVSAVTSFFIYLAVTSGFYTSYRLPLYAMGISSLSVFLVVFATMLYSMNKIKKDNPIDALKNENL